MSLSTLSTAQVLAKYCRKIYEKGFSPATSGNVSLREGDSIYITPTGFCLGEIEPGDIVEMSLAGEQIGGKYRPSSEWCIHRELYLMREDVFSVIHAHPPKSTALAAAHKTIDAPIIAEVIISLGDIPLIPYAVPGTDELAQMIHQYGGQAKAMLLANHGAIAMGKTIREAYFNLEMLESLAEVYILAQSLPGGPQPLNAEQVAEIIRLKKLH